MLNLLHEAIKELPKLMETTEGWSSVEVTYHAPRVERLWCQWGSNRVFLHRIYPCEINQSLFHPHPWPSAVRIVAGLYEHKIGIGQTDPGWQEPSTPTTLVTQLLTEGSEYEMTNPRTWHSVRPLEGPSDSIMVTGPLYVPKVKMPSSPLEKQEPLSPERFDELFLMWKERVQPRTRGV